ncbi:MAG: (Fe-S)-binding protein [Desulfobacteraceae bacterium]|nr:(Fe-S)-binding protein [Desulfobacteraceae bacterium]
MAETPKPDELFENIDHGMPDEPWEEVPPDLSEGRFCYPTKKKNLEYLDMPTTTKDEWSPADAEWPIPDNWKEIIHEGFKDRLEKYRSLKVFMDTCVRCGACADKCHFFIGTGDPKNMPVLRAELLRSVYRNDFTTAGKILGRIAGGRPLTRQVLKEWFSYFYQCTECRRCSVYCPYGIDTAEVTMMARELLSLLGLNINWILEPAANCFRTGNHLGIQPHAFREMIEFFCDDIEEITGVKIEPTFNRKGAEILFITPSGDVFADPGTYTMMGYLLLFEHLGLDYTLSTYASEGGNFGLFTSSEMMKRLNAKMYAEAGRLGVKWILGGECGHMWRVIHQYMDTMNGPADFGETPKSPVTGTVFENAASTRMVHITEFTADLLRNNKLKLDPSRNDNKVVTFHDSCNPSRAMGLLEEPRYVLKHACNHFYEMPENTIREQTFCCGSGSGLNTEEIMELRLLGGLPRANAVKYVHDKYGVNMLACICAIDRAALPPLMDYWVPGVDVTGIHEMVGNALLMEGEAERTMDLRFEPLPYAEETEEDADE